MPSCFALFSPSSPMSADSHWAARQEAEGVTLGSFITRETVRMCLWRTFFERWLGGIVQRVPEEFHLSVALLHEAGQRQKHLGSDATRLILIYVMLVFSEVGGVRALFVFYNHQQRVRDRHRDTNTHPHSQPGRNYSSLWKGPHWLLAVTGFWNQVVFCMYVPLCLCHWSIAWTLYLFCLQTLIWSHMESWLNVKSSYKSYFQFSANEHIYRQKRVYVHAVFKVKCSFSLL